VRSRFVVSILPIVLLLGTSHRLHAQNERQAELFGRAVELLRGMETERAITMLQQLLDVMRSSPEPDFKADVLVHLATAHFAMGSRDSAELVFGEAIQTQPFLTMDPEEHNPDLISAFRRVRSTTPVLGLRSPPDTTIESGGELLAVMITAGKPGNIEVRLTDSQGSGATVASARISGDTMLGISFTDAGSAALPAGRYILSAEYVSEESNARSTIELDVTHLPRDTIPHEPPPSAELFREEDRPGEPVRASIIRGVGLGVAALLIPRLFSPSDLNQGFFQSRAIFVGLAVSGAGVAGAFIGRPRVPIDDNIQHNQALRLEWETRNRAIADQNDGTRRFPPLRIQSAGGR
jgi:hypothetical protein